MFTRRQPGRMRLVTAGEGMLPLLKRGAMSGTNAAEFRIESAEVKRGSDEVLDQVHGIPASLC